MMLADQRHQPAIMHVAFFVGQRAALPVIGFQRLQHIVKASQGEVGVFGQHFFTQGVERLSLGADAGFERFGDVCRERELRRSSALIVG